MLFRSPNMLILSSGAAVNIIVNLTLIPVLGIEGAAIATLIGYAISDIICVIVLCKMKLMVVTKRFLLGAILMTVFIMIWRGFFKENIVIGTSMALVMTFVFGLLYKTDIRKMLYSIQRNERKR